MDYKIPSLAVAAFTAGYIVKSIIAPSSPDELYSILENKIQKEPVKYEKIIDKMSDFSRVAKSRANPGEFKDGYVPFTDVLIKLTTSTQGNISTFVNKETGEEFDIKYVGDKTAVGSYSDRLELLKDEAVIEGRDLMLDIGTKAKNVTGKISDITKEYSGKLKEKSVDALDWTSKKAQDFSNYLTDDKVDDNIDDKIHDKKDKQSTRSLLINDKMND